MSNSSTKQGFATIKCAFQPKEGRSGGGLYTTDGYVAGVCDFADPNEKTGLYAVPEAIHRLLDRNQFMALYQRGGGQPDTLLASDRSRSKAKNAPWMYYRAQNSPLKEPASADEAITLPPFDMVASRRPGTASTGRARGPARVAKASRAARERPDPRAARTRTLRSPNRSTPAPGRARRSPPSWPWSPRPRPSNRIGRSPDSPDARRSRRHQGCRKLEAPRQALPDLTGAGAARPR